MSNPTLQEELTLIQAKSEGFQMYSAQLSKDSKLIIDITKEIRKELSKIKKPENSHKQLIKINEIITKKLKPAFGNFETNLNILKSLQSFTASQKALNLSIQK